MTTETNPYHAPLAALFERLNVLDGHVALLKELIDREKKLADEGRCLYSGGHTCSMTVLVWDLTYKQGDDGPSGFPSGDFSVRSSEQYTDYLQDSLFDVTASAIAQGFEAFETFLYGLLATYFHRDASRADGSTVVKFEGIGKNEGLPQSDVGYWEHYVRFESSRRPKEVLKFIRKVAPDLVPTEKRGNVLNIDLQEWFSAIGEVRHAVTHRQRVIEAEKMQKWTKRQKDYLAASFAPALRADGHRLDTDDVSDLSLFGMYAYQIFKIVSITEGLDWNLAAEWEKGKGATDDGDS